MPTQTLMVRVDDSSHVAVKTLDEITNCFEKTHRVTSVGGIHFLPAVIQDDSPILTRTITYMAGD